MGGMRSGAPGANGLGGDQQVYKSPGKLVKPEDPPIASGLVVYWFPSSGQEFQLSSLAQLAEPLALRYPVRDHGCR